MSEIRHIPYNSTYLNKQMAFAVYLPDEYKYGGKFPVLYFLHGRNGDESFIDAGNEADPRLFADVDGRVADVQILYDSVFFNSPEQAESASLFRCLVDEVGYGMSLSVKDIFK